MKAIKRYYGRRIFGKMVTDYNDIYYVVMSFLGAILGLILMGTILY